MKSIPLWLKLMGGIALLAGACVGLAFVPTGEVAYAPNKPIDLDGRIQVDGRAAEPLQGRMYLVGVTERRVNMLQRLLLDVSDPAVDFAPEPAGRTADGPAPADVRSMDSAKQVAAGIAFELAGERVSWRGTGATVAAVAPDGPARSALEPGDIIVSVNGTLVDTSVEAGRLIHRLPPGSRVRLGVQRAGTAAKVTVPTVAPRSDASHHRSEIGVELSTIGLKIGLPRDVTIDSGNVVGPSAGLAFSLYLYDSLADADLLRGRNVVVTGSLAPDGTVLPVGRIKQKAIASQTSRQDLFVVPAANADDAIAAVEQTCTDGGCTRIVPVSSVQDAVELLEMDDAQLQATLSQRAAG